MTWYDDVVRTIIDLPEAQLEIFDAVCAREGISRAEGVRRAVAGYLKDVRTSGPDPAFGLWRANPHDGVAYQRRLRREWDRRA